MPTLLEQMRAEMGLTARAGHRPAWRVEAADDNFTWVFDGERAVGLICRREDVFELRCHGPCGDCPPAVLPKHYHIVSYEGVRIIFTWRLGGRAGARLSSTLDTTVDGETVRIVCRQAFADGTCSRTTLRLRFDAAWDAYVVDAEAVLDARRVTTALEFCNVLPAGIGDSRPGRERYPLTCWSHPCGLRKMLKNPLWFCSVGAADYDGEKQVAQGGFLGFGPDPRMNPVVEIVHTDPACGAMTCDNLQDEHLMVRPAEGRHAAASGWCHLEACYRLFSVPTALAEEIARRATLMTPGAMLAWKFQYPPIPELPADLAGVELPGSPFRGAFDWSRPVPWDRPFNGRLWTASPDPRAAIHYDRTVGHGVPGSIRLRADGGELAFGPASGHTLHTEAGQRYRFSGWIRTRGQVTGWIAACDMLFRLGDGREFASPQVGPDSDWTRVAAEFVARGDDAPFADTILHARGVGEVWFSELAFDLV